MSHDIRKAQLILALRDRGIRDLRVLEAIEKVPRELFVSDVLKAHAWDDNALPIACGQTISQPFVVAFMTHELKVNERHKVLEIGTGSGYQAAVLSHLCRRVYTIERYRTLAAEAAERFRKLKISNITQLTADGMKGWPQQAPFDRIIVTAAAPVIPPALVEQLVPGGIMIIPIGPEFGEQYLARVTRTDQGYDTERLLDVRFVPLVEGLAREP